LSDKPCFASKDTLKLSDVKFLANRDWHFKFKVSSKEIGSLKILPPVAADSDFVGREHNNVYSYGDLARWKPADIFNSQHYVSFMWVQLLFNTVNPNIRPLTNLQDLFAMQLSGGHSFCLPVVHTGMDNHDDHDSETKRGCDKDFETLGDIRDVVVNNYPQASDNENVTPDSNTDHRTRPRWSGILIIPIIVLAALNTLFLLHSLDRLAIESNKQRNCNTKSLDSNDKT
jgi:hypothetical protein